MNPPSRSTDPGGKSRLARRRGFRCGHGRRCAEADECGPGSQSHHVRPTPYAGYPMRRTHVHNDDDAGFPPACGFLRVELGGLEPPTSWVRCGVLSYAVGAEIPVAAGPTTDQAWLVAPTDGWRCARMCGDSGTRLGPGAQCHAPGTSGVDGTTIEASTRNLRAASLVGRRTQGAAGWQGDLRVGDVEQRGRSVRAQRRGSEDEHPLHRHQAAKTTSAVLSKARGVRRGGSCVAAPPTPQGQSAHVHSAGQDRHLHAHRPR